MSRDDISAEPTGDDDDGTAWFGSKRDRMAHIFERDGATCVWCLQPFDDLNVPTTEHLVPRVKGGPSWMENELASCRRCNRERGHRTLTEYVDEARGRGRTPDVARLVMALERFEAAYTARGGARKSRPYVVSQLRRLRNL